MLKYKAEWEGKIYIEVERFFPSSKTCSNCLNRVDSLSLDIRSWQCPKCGESHDRDINAAKNIRDEGLRILSQCGLDGLRRRVTGLAVGHTATASGGRVRPSKGTAFARRFPVNEESPCRDSWGVSTPPVNTFKAGIDLTKRKRKIN